MILVLHEHGCGRQSGAQSGTTGNDSRSSAGAGDAPRERSEQPLGRIESGYYCNSCADNEGYVLGGWRAAGRSVLSDLAALAKLISQIEIGFLGLFSGLASFFVVSVILALM